ncbi:hypothetical protein KIN20_021244 [Parelaphostrongylus tenuis]|uniref:Protein sleepless n=1 Tax=Parelaphostrongylus tenuis TaxID=148309 RepID=A0AAD5N6W8_PARTN|nr:hypothetical protein KIN20_021244 [Parelaphostrongylus tenuis]
MARGSTTESLKSALFLLVAIPGAVSIGCFVCSSFDGTNRACEDPFNSTIENTPKLESPSISAYHHPCWAFKKGRQGLFPADHCIKITGHRADNTSKTMIIRTCALDSGTLTADTEIVRISHCGHFKFEGYHYTGCVQACDSDGCNSSNLPFSLLILISVLTVPVIDLLRL